jgi:hypothetical protein
MLLTGSGPLPLMNLVSCGSSRAGRGLMGKKDERSKTGLSLSLSLSLSVSVSLSVFSVKVPTV